MSESDYFEFGVAHDRRYTLEHLWLQLIDEKEGTVKIGMSEFIRADYGDVVRVILPHPEDTSDFVLDDEGAPKDADDTNRDSDADNHEIGISELLVTIRTVDDRILIIHHSLARCLNSTERLRITQTLPTMKPMLMDGSSSSNRTSMMRTNSSMLPSTSSI